MLIPCRHEWSVTWKRVRKSDVVRTVGDLLAWQRCPRELRGKRCALVCARCGVEKSGSRS